MTIMDTPDGGQPSAVAPPPSPSSAKPGATGLPATADAVDFALLKSGDMIDNRKIAKIFGSRNNAIVFQSDDGRVYYRVSKSSPAINAAIVEFQRLSMKSVAVLLGVHRHQVNNLLGAAFAAAIRLPDGADIQEPFKTVDEFIDSNATAKVFGRGEGWIVYERKDGTVHLDYPEAPASLTPIIGEFHRIAQLGRTSLGSAETSMLYPLLGTELAVALRTVPPPDPTEAFRLSRDLMQRKLEAHVRTNYTAASLAAAIILGGACAGIFWTDRGLLMGVIGGVIGAIISVLQRSATLEVQQFVPKSQVALQGAVRILLGILFGIILVGAARSGYVLGKVAETDSALFIFGVIAGINERFMPDLLERVASSESGKTAEKKS